MGLTQEEFRVPQTVTAPWTFLAGLVSTQPVGLGQVTLATLPDPAKYTGHVIYVADGAAGSRFLGSDGTAWVSLG